LASTPVLRLSKTRISWPRPTRRSATWGADTARSPVTRHLDARAASAESPFANGSGHSQSPRGRLQGWRRSPLTTGPPVVSNKCLRDTMIHYHLRETWSHLERRVWPWRYGDEPSPWGWGVAPLRPLSVTKRSQQPLCIGARVDPIVRPPREDRRAHRLRRAVRGSNPLFDGRLRPRSHGRRAPRSGGRARACAPRPRGYRSWRERAMQDSPGAACAPRRSRHRTSTCHR
jgi:hypothetical protein